MVTTEVQQLLRIRLGEYVHIAGHGILGEVSKAIGISRQAIYNFRKDKSELSDEAVKQLISYLQDKGRITLDEIDPSIPYLETESIRLPKLERIYGLVRIVHQVVDDNDRRTQMVGKLLSVADRITKLNEDALILQDELKAFQGDLFNERKEQIKREKHQGKSVFEQTEKPVLRKPVLDGHEAQKANKPKNR